MNTLLDKINARFDEKGHKKEFAEVYALDKDKGEEFLHEKWFAALNELREEFRQEGLTATVKELDLIEKEQHRFIVTRKSSNL